MKITGPGTFSQDLDGESWAFDEIRQLAEEGGHAPGTSFTTTVRLTEFVGTVEAEHDLGKFGEIPAAEVAPWIEAMSYIEDIFGETIEVDARVWTCRDWEDFYASVRLDLPSPNEVIAQARAKAGIDPDIEKSLALDRAEAIAQLDAIEARRDAAPEPAPNPYGAPPSALPPAPMAPPWFELLAPDGTPRATPFQRGYVRGSIGKHFPAARAPRMDYLTVGQAHRVCEHFDVDPAPLTQSGRGSMGLFITVLVLFNVAALLLTVAGIGFIFLVAEAAFFIWYFRARGKLQPPFGKQPKQ